MYDYYYLLIKLPLEVLRLNTALWIWMLGLCADIKMAFVVDGCISMFLRLLNLNTRKFWKYSSTYIIAENKAKKLLENSGIHIQGKVHSMKIFGLRQPPFLYQFVGLVFRGLWTKSKYIITFKRTFFSFHCNNVQQRS